MNKSQLFKNTFKNVTIDIFEIICKSISFDILNNEIYSGKGFGSLNNQSIY